MVKFIETLKTHFNQLSSTGKLFRANISGKEVFDLYIAAFPEGSDPIYRSPQSTTHTCNNCNNFIRRYGNIVAIRPDGSIMSIFSSPDFEDQYKIVAEKVNTVICERGIGDVFFETFAELNSLNYEKTNKGQQSFRLGIGKNHKIYTYEEAAVYGKVTAGEVYSFNHIHVDLPKAFVSFTNDSVEKITAGYRDKYSVFKRALEEIPGDVLSLVKELITQGSLLNGTTHLAVLNQMIDHKKVYDDFTGDKDIWCWERTYGMSEAIAKFKNTLIGTLCSELAGGEDLNKACKNWNIRVDPQNYNKAKAPITSRQIEEAKKFVSENGYLDSFDRRLATILDIDVADIKHISNNDSNIAKPVTIFDKVVPTTGKATRINFDAIEEVSIEKFMKEILPSCNSVELYLQNRHEGNLVNLTTSVNKASKPIFKWSNNLSWTFKGNLAGKSQIKEAVKSQGGKVDGDLRFSIMWAEGDRTDNSDLDAWCIQPNGEKIGFSSNRYPQVAKSSGSLDVDIQTPNSKSNTNIVENITFSNKGKMPHGVYRFYINQFADRGSKGFKAEIEFDGTIHSYEYNKPLSQSANVHVAEVSYSGNEFTIKHILPSQESSRELWGMETNTLQKVNLVSSSPNHWGEVPVGNLHYFFMLENAKNPEAVRGFHNENLSQELLDHRKVMEVLGATNMIPSTPDQLAGVGFNSTVKDEVILKLGGSFNRTIKVKF